MKKIIIYLATMLLAAMTFTGCYDLETYPGDKVNEGTFYKTGDHAHQGLMGIYGMLRLNEAYGYQFCFDHLGDIAYGYNYYMMAKDSVQKRLNGEARDGLSFTEFTYQLLQGYDFLHLYETKGCKLQMGGSDQWGNITTGAELIRRTNGGEVFALTCPLITKADGGKFGKTESGNIWLDPRYTSPYKFYQFWLNVSDEDAARYIKIFTSLSQEEVEVLTAEHAEAPHLRVLQKRLAKEVTVMVHSEEDYNAAVEASGILFGNATSEALKKLDEDTLLAVFEGVPQFEVSKDVLAEGVKAVDLFVDNAAVFASKGEMRKLVQGGGVSLNKEKLNAFDQVITTADLLDGKYLLVQRGKKNYYLVIAK